MVCPSGLSVVQPRPAFVADGLAQFLGEKVADIRGRADGGRGKEPPTPKPTGCGRWEGGARMKDEGSRMKPGAFQPHSRRQSMARARKPLDGRRWREHSSSLIDTYENNRRRRARISVRLLPRDSVACSASSGMAPARINGRINASGVSVPAIRANQRLPPLVPASFYTSFSAHYLERHRIDSPTAQAHNSH